MKIKYLFYLIVFLWSGGSLFGQGIPYQLNPPAPNSQVRFCPVPDGGYPCPSPITVYSDSAATQSIAQPISTGSGGNLSVYFAAGTGQVTVQLSGPGYGPQNRFLTTGGSSSGSTSSSAAIMGFYISNSDAPGAANGQRYGSFANTQQAIFCAYTASSATVTCDSYAPNVSASISSNVVTYTFNTKFPVPIGWASGNSITVSGFTGGDTIFNITCTLSTVTATNVTCPLTHANASSTTTGLILNTSAGPFVSTDVGKRIFGYSTCDASFNLVPSANSPITTSTALTILTFTNSTTVQMSGNAANTVTASVDANGARHGCVIWGNPDDTAAAAVDAAMQSSLFCPILHSAAGGYLYTVPHFTKNPWSCISSGANNGAVSAGNIVYNAGFHWEGRGAGATINYITPGFPESGSCNFGFSGVGCWVVPLNGEIREMQFSGGGNAVASGLVSGNILLELDGPAALANTVLLNFGERTAASGTLYCIGAFYLAQFNHVNISGCGTESLATGSLVSITAIQLWIENIGSTGIDVGKLTDYGTGIATSKYSKYHFTCYDCTVGIEGQVDAGTPPFLLVNRNGLAIKWYRGGLSTESFPAQTQNGITGYFNAVSGGSLDMEDAYLDFSTPATGTGYIALQNSAAGSIFLKNVKLGASAGASGGRIYTDVAGSIFQNLGGVTFAPGSTTSQFVVSGKSLAVPSESGQVTCATSAATITFVGTYLFNPIVTIQDQTTAGAVTQTSISTTTKVVGCPGASDVLNYTVTPNPI